MSSPTFLFIGRGPPFNHTDEWHRIHAIRRCFIVDFFIFFGLFCFHWKLIAGWWQTIGIVCRSWWICSRCWCCCIWQRVCKKISIRWTFRSVMNWIWAAWWWVPIGFFIWKCYNIAITKFSDGMSLRGWATVIEFQIAWKATSRIRRIIYMFLFNEYEAKLNIFENFHPPRSLVRCERIIFFVLI